LNEQLFPHDAVAWRAVDVEPRCRIVGLTPHDLLLFVSERSEVAPNEPAGLSPPSPANTRIMAQ
jgi:hypothetical protein